MTEYLEAGSAESIHYASCKRSLGPYHGKIHLILQREGLEALDVGVFQRKVERLFSYAGIAGGTVDLFHLRTAAERIHDRVFATAASDYQDSFSQTVLQFYFLAFNGRSLAGERICKSHIINV